jgi:hypothetical protein
MTHRSCQSHRAQLFALTLSAPLTYRAHIDFNTPPARRRTTDKVYGIDHCVRFAPAYRFAQVKRGFALEECRQDADAIYCIANNYLRNFPNGTGHAHDHLCAEKERHDGEKNRRRNILIPLMDRVDSTHRKLVHRVRHDVAVPPQERS